MEKYFVVTLGYLEMKLAHLKVSFLFINLIQFNLNVFNVKKK